MTQPFAMKAGRRAYVLDDERILGWDISSVLVVESVGVVHAKNEHWRTWCGLEYRGGAFKVTGDGDEVTCDACTRNAGIPR